MGFIGDAWDKAKGWVGGPGAGDPNKIKLPGYEEDRDLIAGQMGQGNPYQQQSSYTGDWRNLISQLQNQPSIAGMQYNQALQQGQAQLGSLSRGSNRPGMAREAMNRSADMTQGAAAGSALAMAQENVARQGALGSALQGASAVEGQVNAANQQAYMQLMAQRLGLNQAQFQALLAREQLKSQNAAMPTGFERAMKIYGDFAAATSGKQGGGAGGGGMGGLPPGAGAAVGVPA